MVDFGPDSVPELGKETSDQKSDFRSKFRALELLRTSFWVLWPPSPIKRRIHYVVLGITILMKCFLACNDITSSFEIKCMI